MDSRPCSSISAGVNVADNKEKKGGTTKRSGTKGVKLSTDPQSIAARQRRHRISDRFKILQSLVPGGTRMDTVSMLEEAIHYVKFLKTQIWLHQTMMNYVEDDPSLPFTTCSSSTFSPHDQQSSLVYTSTLPSVMSPPPPAPAPSVPYYSYHSDHDAVLSRESHNY